MRLRLSDPLFVFVGRALAKPLVLAGVGLSMLFGGYQLLGPPQNTDQGFMKRKLAERVCEKVSADLPKPEGTPSLAVLRLAGDEQGYMSGLLREKIAASGGYRVLDETFLAKLLREFDKSDVAVSRLSDAVASARQLGVDLALFGDIPEFTTRNNAASLKLEVRMAERGSGQAVFVHSYSEEIGGSLVLSSYWRARIADSSKGRRVVLWVAFTLLLPLLTVPLIRRLTAVDSNMLNLMLLLGYTLADMLVALLLTGFWIPRLWTAIVLIAALAGSGYYNYRIATLVDRMQH